MAISRKKGSCASVYRRARPREAWLGRPWRSWRLDGSTVSRLGQRRLNQARGCAPLRSSADHRSVTSPVASAAS
jgi:hypothetical protein